jgi:YHS domain-containing protein
MKIRREWMGALLAGGVALGAASYAAEPGRAKPGRAPIPKKAACLVDYTQFNVTPQSLAVYINDSPRFFCSAVCRSKFASWPEKYARDLVVYCTVQPNFKGWIQLSRRLEVNNGLYYLCCDPCVGYMRDKPWFYLKETEILDPINGHWFKPVEGTPRTNFKGQIYLFETGESKAAFDKEPDRYALVFRR